KQLFYQYVARLRKMQEMALPMQMALQGGKIGRGSAVMFGAMLNAMPGPGTFNSTMAREQWRQFGKTVDAISPDLGDYVTVKFRSIADEPKDKKKPPLPLGGSTLGPKRITSEDDQ